MINFDIIVIISSIILLTVLIVSEYIKDNYDDPNAYNYDEENPHALITGENIAGTVFASDPENAPGLGWIL